MIARMIIFFETLLTSVVSYVFELSFDFFKQFGICKQVILSIKVIFGQLFTSTIIFDFN